MTEISDDNTSTPPKKIRFNLVRVMAPIGNVVVGVWY